MIKNVKCSLEPFWAMKIVMQFLGACMAGFMEEARSL